MVVINDTPYGCVEVFLDSSHGQRFNEYHNEVSFYFNETLVRVSQNYDLVLQVMSASIPLAYDNIDDDIDNTKLVVFKQGGMFSYDVDQTIELPNGNYNIKDLKTAINAQLAASTNATSTISMDYNRVTGRTTFSSSDNYDFSIKPSRLASMLGFSNELEIGSSGGFCVGIKKVDVRRTQSLYIVCPDVITDCFDSHYMSRASVLARVPIDVSPYNNVLHWRNLTGVMTKVHTRNVNSFFICIVDDERKIVKFSRPWQLNVQIDVSSHKDILPYAQHLYMSNGKEVMLPPDISDE